MTGGELKAAADHLEYGELLLGVKTGWDLASIRRLPLSRFIAHIKRLQPEDP